MKKSVFTLIVLVLTIVSFSRTINITSGGQTTSYNMADIQSITFDSVTTNMVFVDSGTFSMGDASYAVPIHSVSLSSYYIGKYEVTQAEWLATMGSNPSNHTEDLNKPVEMVGWYDIMVYCNKRSIDEGITPCYTINNSTNPADWGSVPGSATTIWNSVICNWSANGYRLPTEAEWEFAAIGGNNSQGFLYSGSNTLGDAGWCIANSGNTTHPVGLKVANELGLYDMTGNITEWNWDLYAVYSANAQTNPTGPTTGTYRMCRGGSYSSNAFYFLNTTRNFSTPYGGGYALGFRVCKSY